MDDAWSVFDDDTPETNNNNTNNENKNENKSEKVTQQYNSSYGASFLSSHKSAIVDFINDGITQMVKDLTEHKQAGLAATVRLGLISLKASQWAQLNESADRAVLSCWLALEGQKWDHVAWREAYVYSQLMMITVDIMRNTQDQSNLQSAIRRVDLSIILGAPQHVMEPISLFIEKHMDLSAINSTKNIPSLSFSFTKESLPKLPSISHQIKIEENLPIEKFTNTYFKGGEPVVIRGAMQDWPAMSKWTDMKYFISRFGHRTVPIELGKHDHRDGGKWKEDLITLKDFINKYIIPSCSSSRKGEAISDNQIAYLAQHHLFNQLTNLQDDIRIPPYAASNGEVANINAWFGTASTTTPLHYDSYHNCLTQVFGYKYIRLYKQTETPKLYVHESADGGDSSMAQGNISKVNLDDVDTAQYPLFAQAEYTETLLGPGDILFMPAGIWHYVRSCSPSFSVSFWFE